MKKLSNSEAELKKSVAYKKKRVLHLETYFNTLFSQDFFSWISGNDREFGINFEVKYNFATPT